MKIMIVILFSALLCACSGKTGVSNDNEIPKMPITAIYENSLEYESSKKKVIESQLLSDMETMGKWEYKGTHGTMTLSTEKPYQGKSSFMITSPTKGETNPNDGRPWGIAGAYYNAGGEDWTKWNRISFWIYPDLPGFKIVSINTIFFNDGEDKVPDRYSRNGFNYQILENQKWNKVYWEIEHLGREKVVGLEIRYRLQGNEPGAAENIKYYLDNICLEKVEPDHYEGWDVQPGQIAYNHAGYTVNFPKTALIPDASVKSFSLIDAATRAKVLEGTVESQNTPTGTFQVADFTNYNVSGTYILEAGNLRTKPFVIDQFSTVFRSSIIKTINHFYTQRCGYAVEGVHDACHLDWLCRHGDLSVSIHGGWHDAGDLSQGLSNTNDAAYSMLLLAEKLKKSDPVLADRILEEARWGMAWILKTRFGDGFRTGFTTKDMWTDDIIGNGDDYQGRASNNPQSNYAAATTEATAALAFKTKDKFFSDYALKCAIEDFDFAEERSQPRTGEGANRQVRQNANSQSGTNANSQPAPNANMPFRMGARGQFRMSVDLATAVLNASLALYEATSDEKYKNIAIKYADSIVVCQQQTDLDTGLSLKGFFHRTTAKNSILHYAHIGNEHKIIAGLIKASELFPDKAVEWKKALRLYADYYKEITAYNAPYFMIPAGVYDLTQARGEEQIEQIQGGIKLNDRYFIKRFPVWGDFRGNSGTTLTQAKALADIANFINDKELLNIAYCQLEWHLGKNPFAQSLMYGEGYRFAAQYSIMSGNLVGGLPVGVQTHFNRDAPYWPAENCYNWKEIWVHPSMAWFMLMCNFV